LNLFNTDLDRRYVDVRPIPKMGCAAVDSNEVFIDGLSVPTHDLISEEGRGFECFLHSLNSERVLVGAEAVGIGQNAMERTALYAGERAVFGRPIGQNLSIQHPLAKSWIELEAAHLLAMRAAWFFDQGRPSGAQANVAKYAGAEAGFRACTRAVMTFAGIGYAKEFHVERLLREVLICRIARISPQLILCNIAENVLDLPKSC
jgi:acyl-CoA dehydrogenase